MPRDPSAFRDDWPLAQIAAALGIKFREVRALVEGEWQARMEMQPADEKMPPPLGAAQQAEWVGRSDTTILRMLERRGIERRHPARRVDSERVVALRSKGITHWQIAAELGCSAGVVGKHLRRAGIHGALPKRLGRRCAVPQ